MAVTERDAGIRTSMVPPSEVLPDVLPTDRLGPTGKPIRQIRDGLRRIDDRRNVGSVLLTWGHAAVTIGLALYVDHPVAWVASFVLMGAVHARMAILIHEAAHQLLFTDRKRVVSGKRVSVRVDPGGRRFIKKKKT